MNVSIGKLQSKQMRVDNKLGKWRKLIVFVSGDNKVGKRPSAVFGKRIVQTKKQRKESKPDTRNIPQFGCFLHLEKEECCLE